MNSSLSGLPTWVPDWSLSSDRIALLNGLIMCSVLTLGDDFNYFACNGLSTDAVISDDRRALNVSGIPIGTIHRLGDAYYANGSMFPEALMQQWQQIAAKLDPYITGQTADTALLQTIFASQLKYGTDYDIPGILLARWFEALRIATNVDIQEALGSFEDPNNRYADLREINDTVQRVCSGRRFASTTTGYMGLVPAESECGDIVSVLLGGQVPFILRKRDNEYVLVGEAYVHGLMKGESMKIAESSHPALQRLTIH